MLAEVPDQSQDVGGGGHLLGDAPVRPVAELMAPPSTGIIAPVM